MLSPISMSSPEVQQAQQVQVQAQAASVLSASVNQAASLKPDTVSISPQGQAAVSHDGDSDGH